MRNNLESRSFYDLIIVRNISIEASFSLLTQNDALTYNPYPEI